MARDDRDEASAAPRSGEVTPEAKRGRLLVRPGSLPSQAPLVGYCHSAFGSSGMGC